MTKHSQQQRNKIMEDRAIADTRKALIENAGLSLKCEFVPFSQSRNKDNEHKSINWKVTLLKSDKPVLITDYSQGVGHIPGYSTMARKTLWLEEQEKISIEQGKYKTPFGGDYCPIKSLPSPKIEDVLYGLITDSEVIDYDSFESWADNMGFDPDSRKDEKIYQACLEIGLKLRNRLGDKLLSELRDSFQDY